MRILCTDRQSEYPIVGLIETDHGDETIGSWRKDGQQVEIQSGLDLVNVPVKREGWIGVTPNEPGKSPLAHTTYAYATRECAIAASDNESACQPIRIEWEEV